MNITAKLRQTALYWGAPSPDGYGGYTFADPVEMPCRWEDRQELFLREPGKEELSHSIVYTATPVVTNGFLYLGVLADLESDMLTPYDVPGAMEVRNVQASPGISAQHILHKAIL